MLASLLISWAMARGDSTKSTQPVRIALLGIPDCCADSSCAKVIPPAALMASMPFMPSLPVPESTMPMARDPWLEARAWKKMSTEKWIPGSRSRRRKWPSSMIIVRFGAIT